MCAQGIQSIQVANCITHTYLPAKRADPFRYRAVTLSLWELGQSLRGGSCVGYRQVHSAMLDRLEGKVRSISNKGYPPTQTATTSGMFGGLVDSRTRVIATRRTLTIVTVPFTLPPPYSPSRTPLI